MEILVDFGAALSRTIYAKKLPGIVFLIVFATAPVTLLIVVSSPIQRWIAATCLTTALVNIAVIGAVLQTGRVPVLKLTLPLRGRELSTLRPHPSPAYYSPYRASALSTRARSKLWVRRISR